MTDKNFPQIKLHAAEWHDIPAEHKVGQIALDSHYDTLITEPTLVFANDKPVAAYFAPSINMYPLLQAVSNVKIGSTLKNGIKVFQRQFGWCGSETDFRKKYEHEWGVISDFAELILQGYHIAFPDRLIDHQREANHISEEKRIRNTPFTNGLINKDSAVPYHFDRGNFEGACTCTYNLNDDIEGGYLVFPQLRTAFKCANNTACVFDGDLLLHGVTPIRKQSELGYRYSVLYYTMKSNLDS